MSRLTGISKVRPALMYGAAIGLVVVTVVAGCASDSTTTTTTTPLTGDPGGYYQRVITMPVNGTLLTCVYVGGGDDGGPSCDWQGWHEDRKPK